MEASTTSNASLGQRNVEMAARKPSNQMRVVLTPLRVCPVKVYTLVSCQLMPVIEVTKTKFLSAIVRRIGTL